MIEQKPGLLVHRKALNNTRLGLWRDFDSIIHASRIYRVMCPGGECADCVHFPVIYCVRKHKLLTETRQGKTRKEEEQNGKYFEENGRQPG